MCIRYDIDTGVPLRFSKSVGAWIPETDFKEGRDQFPGYVVPAVRPFWGASKREVARELVGLRWGLQPAWTGDPNDPHRPPWADDPNWGKRSAYNARSETIFARPAFRRAIMERRCVIPISAFYEQEDGRWWRFRHPDRETLAVAGIFEEPNAMSDAPTVAMVTTEPTQLALSVNHDRSLVILDPDGIEAWLSERTPKEYLRALMIPPPEDLLIVEDAGSNKRKKEVPPDQGSLF